METLPFDPADYLDSEEKFAVYLADARADGPEAVSDAVVVVARARARMSPPGPVTPLNPPTPAPPPTGSPWAAVPPSDG